MNEGPVNQGDMIDTTDSLEAVAVFRGWKNIFFIIVLVGLLLTQAAFWLVDLGVVKVTPGPEGTPQVTRVGTAGEASRQTATDVNQPIAVTAKGRFAAGFVQKLDFGYLARTVEVVNGILIVAAMLYCLTLFFGLMVSLVGRLGGINHISRAFTLSLIMLVLILPWQNVLGSSVVGVIYTPAELTRWLAAKGDSTANMVIYYLRFTVYWVALVLLLLLSQARSTRWSKAILRRLEII
jgi:hypothetical protein